jgi:hypothetical protein
VQRAAARFSVPRCHGPTGPDLPVPERLDDADADADASARPPIPSAVAEVLAGCSTVRHVAHQRAPRCIAARHVATPNTDRA